MAGNLTGIPLLIIDIVAWFCINLAVSWLVSLRHAESFNPDSWLYVQRSWENNASFYKSVFNIKVWKKWLPDGAAVSKNGFRKKHLLNSEAHYLQTFIQETCRAEFLHWVLLAFSAVFFIWNAWYIGILMVVYAVIVNFPCILTQRYNRIRLTSLIEKVP